MKHTLKTATARAIQLGYGGKYIELDSKEFNQGFLRSQKYARASAIETSPERRDYLAGEARA